MTQVKCRAMGGNGMTQAAWKYAMQRQVALESRAKCRESIEAVEEAKKKNITLPKLKWMEGR